MPFDRSFKYHLLHVTKREAKFSQAKGLGNLDDADLSAEVSGGYCFGAAMCWLRVTMAKEVINYSGFVDHGKPGIVKLMARGHVEHSRLQDQAASNLRDAALAHTDTMYEAIERRRQKESDEAFAVAEAEMAEASREYSANFSTFADQKELKDKMDQVTAYLDEVFATQKIKAKEKMRQAKQLAQTRADRTRELVAPNVTPEEVVKETWKLLEAVEKRKYTGELSPVKRIATEGTTVGDFVVSVVDAPSFTSGRGMIINFETGKAPTANATVLNPPGHAVALYRFDANTYWLFEPNLGVFIIDGRVNAMYALVLIMADGYDKRILGDDRAIVFSKTEKTFPDQGGDAVDPSLMVDRDKAKNAMKEWLEQLAKDAFKQGLETLKARRDQDEKLIASAGKALQGAFLRARIASAATKPSELLEKGSAGADFMTGKGQLRDTGLFPLYESLNAIF